MTCGICRKAAMYTVCIGTVDVCEECIDEAKDKLAFQTWMEKVDRFVDDKVGVNAHELPDVPFRFWFDDDISPEEATEMALEYAGWEE